MHPYTYCEICSSTCASSITALSVNLSSPSSPQQYTQKYTQTSPPSQVRIELCTSPSIGGLTPSISTVRRVSDYISSTPGLSASMLTVLIRPHEGGFAYSSSVKDDLIDDAKAIVEVGRGVGGLAVGATTVQDGGGVEIDFVYLKKLISAVTTHCVSKSLPTPTFTLHRCCDDVLSLNLYSGEKNEAEKEAWIKEWMAQVKEAGFSRILTSGGRPNAVEGIDVIKTMSRSEPGIMVVAGGGINSGNVKIFKDAGCCVHVGSGVKVEVEEDGMFGGRTEVNGEMVEVFRRAFRGDEAGTEGMGKVEGGILDGVLTKELIKRNVREVISEYTDEALGGLDGTMKFTVKLAENGDDVKSIMTNVINLAIFEKEPNAVNATVETYARDGGMGEGGERGMYFCLLVRNSLEEVGMGFFYFAYSTWEGRVLHLEDLYVDEKYRGKGVGGVLMRTLAKIAVKNGCKRFQWQALDWNVKAIEFYEKIGANVLSEWVNLRMEGKKLNEYAAGK